MTKSTQFKKRYQTKARQVRAKYPAVKPVPRSAVNGPTAKAYYGGAFPTVKGAKHTYPAPDDSDAWLYLLAEALTYRRVVRYCLKERVTVPKDPKRSQYEYVLYHCRPDEKKRRATRNRHRDQLGLKVGDPRHVHHTERNNLTLSKAVVLTPCEHRQAHGQVCRKKDKAIPAGSKRFKHGHVPVSKLHGSTTRAERTLRAPTKKPPVKKKVSTAAKKRK